MTSESSHPQGIDPQLATASATGAPYNAQTFAQMRVIDTWQKYHDVLTWGKGQCLAILDDGCDLSQPAWQAKLPWGPKVIATWNSIDGNDNCHPVPPGYHGTTVGYPSSMNLDGVRGVAYQNHVAHVRCITVVHLTQDESATIAAGLQWVIEHHEKFNITSVNLAPVDDQKHQSPMPTAIDGPLRTLRELGVWVSAPAGNHHYTDGISWPACQPHCFAIGGTIPGEHKAHLDRFSNIDLLVAASATSSSNAYAAACAQILHEAIEKTSYPWQEKAATRPEAIMAIFQETGVRIDDAESGLSFRELDLLAAVDHVFGTDGSAR